MALVYLYQNRRVTKDITIVDVNGDTITPSVADKVRATIGRLGETAKLTVTSGTPTANGSTFTKGAANRLTLVAADIQSILPGTYSLLIDYYNGVDNSWKNVDRQCCVIEKT